MTNKQLINAYKIALKIFRKDANKIKAYLIKEEKYLVNLIKKISK